MSQISFSFAHVARRQSLPEACINIISKIQSVASGIPSADLNDAFAKLREQARACLQLPNHSQHGLDLLQRTDIKNLSAVQKSDLYLTKAELLLYSTSLVGHNGDPMLMAASHKVLL